MLCIAVEKKKENAGGTQKKKIGKCASVVLKCSVSLFTGDCLPVHVEKQEEMLQTASKDLSMVCRADRQLSIINSHIHACFLHTAHTHVNGKWNHVHVLCVVSYM